MFKLTDIAYDETTAFNNLQQLVPLRNKRVLEVGGNMPEDLIRKSYVQEWVAIDPIRRHIVSDDGLYTCIKTDLLNSDLQKSYFDVVFSSNAFEHINNFKQCLSFLFDCLKPGGKLFAHFGPIWSAPDGHHLEDVKLTDETIINFWENNIIPEWFHLIYNKKELTDILMQIYDERDARIISSYIYDDKNVNRLFFKDYITSFIECGFKIKLLKTTDEIDYKMDRTIKPIDLCEANKILKNKYGNDDYSCRDIIVFLER